MTGVPNWAVWVETIGKVAWLAIAIAVAVTMRRRGHDGGLWLLVGFLLGPASIVAAIVVARRASGRPPTVVTVGSPGPGMIDLLAVVDTADPASAVSWIDAQSTSALRRLILVAVVGRDTFDQAARSGELRRARSALATAADVAHHAGLDATQLIIEGRPEPAVAAAATGQHVDLVVVAATAPARKLAARLQHRLGTTPVLSADTLDLAGVAPGRSDAAVSDPLEATLHDPGDEPRGPREPGARRVIAPASALRTPEALQSSGDTLC